MIHIISSHEEPSLSINISGPLNWNMSLQAELTKDSTSATLEES